MTEAELHNEALLRDLDDGDMVEFPRNLISHFGIYVGHGKVVHLSGVNDGIGDGLGPKSVSSVSGAESGKAVVKEEDFKKVADKSKAKKSNKDGKKSPISNGSEIVRRARSQLGRVGYNVLFNNCEHFATWCRYDVNWSDQVATGLTVALTIHGGLPGYVKAKVIQKLLF